MSYCVNISQANHCNGASSRYEFFSFIFFFHCCIPSTQNSARHVHSSYSLNICQMKEWIHSFHYWWTLRLTSIVHHYQKSFPKLWQVFLSTRVRVSLTCLPRYVIIGVRCFVFSVFLDPLQCYALLDSLVWHTSVTVLAGLLVFMRLLKIGLECRLLVLQCLFLLTAALSFLQKHNMHLKDW